MSYMLYLALVVVAVSMGRTRVNGDRYCWDDSVHIGNCNATTRNIGRRNSKSFHSFMLGPTWPRHQSLLYYDLLFHHPLLISDLQVILSGRQTAYWNHNSWFRAVDRIDAILLIVVQCDLRKFIVPANCPTT